LAMICHYQEAHVDSDGVWQVLRRVADRCGREVHLGTVTVRPGVWIDVPRVGSDQLVYARIHGIRSGIPEFIRALLYKAEPVMLAERGRGTWRLVIGTAEGPLVLRAPWAVGYSGVFGYPRHQEAIRIEYPVAGSIGDALVTVDFFAVPLDFR